MIEWLKSLAGWRSGIAATRHELEQKKQRREFLQTAPLACAEALAVELEYIDACATMFRENVVEHAKTCFSSDPWERAKDPRGAGQNQFSIVSHRHGRTTEADPRLIVGALAVPLREALKSAFAAQTCWPGDCGPSLDERRAEIATLDAEIAALAADLDKAKTVAAQEGVRL